MLELAGKIVETLIEHIADSGLEKLIDAFVDYAYERPMLWISSWAILIAIGIALLIPVAKTAIQKLKQLTRR